MRTYPQELDVKADHRPNCAQDDHVSQYTGVLALDVARFPYTGMYRYRASPNLCTVSTDRPGKTLISPEIEMEMKRAQRRYAAVNLQSKRTGIH